MVDRGGLTRPSDIVFITCLHVWTLYSNIMHNEFLRGTLMASTNPRNTFIDVFIHKLEEYGYTGIVTHESCDNGCSFTQYISKIASATFNIKKTNFISRENDIIHCNRKRSNKPKVSHVGRKIKKLNSN